jgi:endonuclease/exonuclease/phosphatase family metal-dependent hydrolase
MVNIRLSLYGTSTVDAVNKRRFVKELLVCLLAGVVLLASMAGKCHAAAATPTGEQPNLRVLTWNLQLLPTALDQFSAKLQKSQHLRAPWIIDYLNHQDYDIVVLEEVIDPGITDDLKRGLKEHYPYIVAPASRMGVAGASGGILFAAKIPLQYITHIEFKHVAGVDAWAEKGCTLVEAEKDGVRFQIAGTHLQAGHQDMKDMEYKELADAIILPHKKEGVPLILMGDMNTKPGTDKFDLLLKTTEMTAFAIDDPSPFTSDSLNSWRQGKTHSGKPDHVLLNPRGTGTAIMRQTIQRARKEHEGKTIDLSDHYGLVADILLKK